MPFLRVSSENVQHARYLLAALLNSSTGGSLEVAHQAVFNAVGMPLKPVPDSLANTTKFHLEVISSLDPLASPHPSAVWCSKPLEFTPRTSAKSSQNHLVLYETGNASVRFDVAPLPASHLALIYRSQALTRMADQRAALPLSDWWRNLCANNITYAPGLVHPPCTSSLVDEPPTHSYGAEKPWREFKWCKEVDHKPLSVVLKTHGTRYLTEALLNATGDPNSGTVSLLLGIEDSTALPTGMALEWKDSHLSSDLNAAFHPDIFPPLDVTDFEIVFHRLVGSSLQDWDDEELQTLTLLPHHALLALLFVKGRAVVLPQPLASTDEDDSVMAKDGSHDEMVQKDPRDASDYRVIVMPKSHANELRSLDMHALPWSRLSPVQKKVHAKLKKAEWLKCSPACAALVKKHPSRYVLEIINTERRFKGTYYRTEDEKGGYNNKLTLLAPVMPPLPLNTANLTSEDMPRLNARAIWLRSRTALPLSRPIVEHFLSSIFLPVIFASDETSPVFQSLSNYLGFDLAHHAKPVCITPSGASYDVTNPAHVPNVPDDLPVGMLTSPYPNVAAVSLPDWPSLYVRASKDLKRSWRVVILVPDENMQNWCIPPCLPNISILALLPLVCPPSKLRSPSKPHAGASGPEIQTDLIPDEPLLSSSEVVELFRSWLFRKDPKMTLPWATLKADMVVLTCQAKRILQTLEATWNQPPNDTHLQELSLLKVFPASGASCTLRSVAWETHIRGSAFVCWIKAVSLSSPDLLAEVLLASLGSAEKVLICTDQLPHAETVLLREVLTSLDGNDLHVVWLNLTASSPRKWDKIAKYSPCTPISPFIELQDMEEFERKLGAIAFRTEPLSIIASLARSPDSRLESRHVFAFAIAATKVVNTSIAGWIRKLYENIAQSPRLRDVACAFAFVSAFAVDSPPHHQYVSEDPFTFNRLSYTDEALEAFDELFPLVHAPAKFQSAAHRASLHPFLARLFLANRYQLHWNEEYLDFQELSTAWKDTIAVLSPSPNTRRVLSNLLIAKRRSIFTPLIVDAYTSCFAKQNLGILDIESDFIAPLATTLKFGARQSDVLISRLWRCQAFTSAAETDNAQKYIDKALESARKAAKDVQEPKKVVFLVRRNLATMLLSSFSEFPSLAGSEKEAHLILGELYASIKDPKDRDDLVALALKSLTSKPYLDEWARRAPHAPRRTSAHPLPVSGWNFQPTAADYRIFAEAGKGTLKHKR